MRRLQLVLLGLWAVVLWTAFSQAQALHRALPWTAAVPMALWLLGVLGIGSPSARRPLIVALYACAAAAAAADNATATLLLVSAGLIGAVVPWRRMRVLGLPLLALTCAIVLLPALRQLGLGAVMESGTGTLVVVVALSLLVGRLFSDAVGARREFAGALEDLREAHARLERQAADAAEVAALRERARLARDLHDTLGHALSAITVEAEAARRLLARDETLAEGAILEVQDTSRRALRDLREHLQGLREPPRPVDLPAELRRLAEDAAARNGWSLKTDVGQLTAGREADGCLLQVAREALTNVERHGGATAVTVSLRGTDGAVELTIADDGRGFDGEPTAGHYGLRGMRERLGDVGGSLTVRSARARGTVVIARVPQKTEGGREAAWTTTSGS